MTKFALADFGSSPADPRAVPPNVNAGTAGSGSRAVCLSDLFLPFAGRRAPRTGLRSVSAWVAALAAGLVLTLWFAFLPAQAQRETDSVNLTLSTGGTACTDCPATPTGHATPGPGAGEITLRWAPGVDTRTPTVPVASWQLYRGNTDFTALGSDNVSSTTRSHTFSGLVPGQLYGVGINAKEASDTHNTIISGVVRAGAADPPEAPSAPTAAAVTGKGGHLSVSWTAPATNGAAITDYDLRYFAGSADPTNASDWVEDGEVTGLPALSQDTSTDPPTAPPVSGTITGLKPSTAYRVQVRAQNAGGESAWSSSGSGTTNAASGSNNAPIVVVQATLDPVTNIRCAAHSATTPSYTHNSPAGNLVSTVLTVNNRSDWPQYCVGNSDATRPLFHDPNNEDLAISVAVTLPDNVRSMHRPGEAAYPLVQHYMAGGESGWRLFNRAVAAGSRTDVPVTVTATDPQGASKSITYTFQAGTFPPTVGAPSFNGSVGVLEFVQNAKGSAVLPPAIGGDTQNGAIPYYLYKVTGLPPGLTFDEETRTVSGTPTTAGTWTATYLADDYDGQYSQKASPTAADTADAARQTFTVRVVASTADGPSIDLVRIVSHPTHNAGFTGTNDTYIAGDEILVDVEYSEPVEVVGGYDNVRLRLDLGTDDTTLTNSREVMKLKQVLNGGRTLRFAYTVEAGPGTRTCSSNPRATDCDTDGIWVQTTNLTSNFNMIFLASNAKVRSAATGVDAGRVRAGLPTSGDGRHKVDGGRTSVAGPVPASATIDGRTLEVTFDKALNTSVDTGQLMYYLSIHGAGDVGGGHRNADQYPDAISISGQVLTLTLSKFTPATASDIVTLSYSGGTNLLRTATGNHAAPAFRDLAVTNIMEGAVGPLLQRASVAGQSLRLVFDSPLDTASLPAGNTFRVFTQDFDGDTRNIGGQGTVSIQGNTVTVGLAAAVRLDELLSVSYAPPTTGKKLQSATYATAVKAFSGFRVETVADITGPTFQVANFFVNPEASTRTIAVIYFDEALDTNSVPAPADFNIRCCFDLGVINNSVPFGITVTNNAVSMELPQGSTVDTTGWKFAYTPGANPIRDLAGNATAKIAELDVVVRNNGKPTVTAGGTNVDGADIRFSMDLALDPGSVPDPSAFTLHDTDADSTQLFTGVEAVRLESTNVYLRLAHPVRPCDGQAPIRVKYTKPTGSNAAPLQGIDGTDADSFPPRNVTNKRHGQCRDGQNWLSHMTIGSVVIRANRPFATDKAPKPEWFSVTASGGPVTVTGAAFDPNDAHVLKLTLSREFAAGETVTARYRRPAGESGLWDVDCYPLGDVTDWPVRAKAGLSASFHSLPDAHDGRKLFTCGIRFSEEFQGMRLTTLKRALQVTGGRLIDVKRTVRGQNQGVTVRVRPSQAGDVTLSLPATADCSAADAVCTPDGRKLSAASATVPGPDSAAGTATLPVLSVTDARAAEGGNLEFAVTLDAAAAGEITVEYTTVDGTATASADYTAASGTLTFAAGETSKTVSVALLRDAAVEVDETLTLALSGASGATIGTASATGTVANSAPPADTTPPAPSAAEVDGHIATVTFGEDLAPASTQWFNFQWTVTGTGAQHHPDRAWIADKRTVKLRLAQNFPAVAGQTVTLKYEPSDYLRDAAGNRVAFFRMEAENLTLPVLSVDDARAAEGTDATLDFTVRMDAAVEGTVTVEYATRDGTAKAGEDYTGTSGTLTFAPGDTEKTVSVPILDDALDEGAETFTLRLTNANGARIGDGEATGTIENSDPLQTMWLSRFGRTVADHVVGAVSDRLANPMTGVQVTVGGQSLDLAQMEDGEWIDRTMVSMARVLGVPDRSGTGDDGWPDTGLGIHESPTFGSAPVRSITGREILLGSSFHLARDGEGGGTGMTAWGRVTTGGFDGEAPADGGNVRIDGEVTTGILGTDAQWGRVLAGVALSVSEGEGTFDQSGVDSGTIESTMTTGSPYARVDLNDRISAWGMAGRGTGDMTIVQKANTATNQPERITRSDLSLRMAAVGGRGALMTPGQTGGMDLVLKADAFLVQTESEAVSGEGGTKADASRVRLILEGSRAFKTDNGVLTPGLELGLRHDGGDAETGTGIELGGRISYVNPDTGLSLEANVRALMAHEDSNYEEWGASGALRLVPGARGRGLSFSLTPTYGAPGSGVEQLWSARDAGGLAQGGNTFDPESRVEGEIGYRVGVLGDRFTGTPNIGFGLSDGGSREYRLGWRLARANGGSTGSFGSFALSLDATRSEPASNNESGSGTAPAHAIVLRTGVGW